MKIAKFNNFYILIILILISLLVGIISILILPNLNPGDSQEYISFANDFIKNKVYRLSDGYLLAPGYPFFLILNFLIFGNNFNLIYLIQFIFLGIIGFTIYLISNKYLALNKKISFATSLLTILWPYFILYSKILLTENLFTFFLTLSILFLLNSIATKNKKTAILSGIFMGIATLIRPVIILLPFWIVFFISIQYFSKIRKLINKPFPIFKEGFFKLTVIGLLFFLFTISPWIIYASIKMGHLTPISSHGGKMLSGTNTSYTYEYANYQTPGYEPWQEVKLSKILLSKTKNIYRFWKSGASGAETKNLANSYPFLKYFLLLYRIIYYTIIILMFYSLTFIKKNHIISIIWIIIFYFWFFHSVVFQPYPRYTLPIIPLVLILSLYSIHKIIFSKISKTTNSI